MDATIQAMKAAFRLHLPAGVAGFVKARTKSHDKTAYSVTWAALRTRKTIRSRCSWEMSGTKKRTKGPINLELVEADLESADAEKMTAIQIRTGSQYRRNFCLGDTRR